MGDEMLAGVCELAFDVAKQGNAPSTMKNYLYLAQRPPRAYSVAQRALEEDDRFRARVAERATIDNVGEAGYLWLHRPAGWEQRLSALRSGVEPIGSDEADETPMSERPPMPVPPTDDASTDVPSPTAVTPATTVPSAETDRDKGFPSPRSSGPARTPEGPAPTVSSIESELSSLRGLVDRLADERQNVRSSVSELELELETRRKENLEMSTKLSALRTELTTTQSSESTILLERDRALVRITELEADVAKLTADVERMAAEAEGSSSEHEAALTDLALVSSERDSLREERDRVAADLETVSSERDSLRDERDGVAADLATVSSERDSLATAAIERDNLRGELDAVVTDRNALTAEFGDVRAERDGLVERLETTSTERNELTQLLASAEASRVELEERLEVAEQGAAAAVQLREEKAELTARLNVAEQARVDLEGQLEDVSQKWQASTRQLSVFENVNSQLDSAVAERDAAEAKLVQANESLEVLRRSIGTSHDQIRSELASVEAAFGPVGDVADTDLGDDVTDTDPVETDDLVPADAEAVDQNDVSIDADLTGDSHVDDEHVDDEDEATDQSPAPEAVAEAFDTGDLSGSTVAETAMPLAEDATEDDDEPLVVPTFDDATLEPADEVFDGEGIELDSTLLGGRTIGDMFGGGDESESIEPDASVADAGIDSLDAIDDVDTGVGTSDEADGDDAEIDETPAAAGRRRLTITEDPASIDFARSVVETDDVVLLIDGDGAASLGWPHLDVATRRDALVAYLGTLTADTGAAADVVFARPVGGEDSLPVSRAVRVRIADEAVAESSIFESIANGYPEEWPIAIVSDEANLTAQAEALEATALTNDQLLDLFLGLSGES